MSTCQVNPLTQFVTKGDQNHGFMHRLGPQNNEQHQLHVKAAPEDVFLYGQDINTGNRFMGGMHSGATPMTAAVPILPMGQQQEPREQRAMHQDSGNSSWLSQFHSMRIEDPLEFSQDYKKMYSSYEKSSATTTTTTPMVRFPMASCRPTYGTTFSRDLNQQKQHQEISPDNQGAFTAEFEALEKELQEVENKQPMFDQEQKEFQQIANEIVTSCSPSPSKKLWNSKFMGLMRGIGEGAVTLNKEKSQKANELHSPQTGERIGNEYFPIRDNTLHYE